MDTDQRSLCSSHFQKAICQRLKHRGEAEITSRTSGVFAADRQPLGPGWMRRRVRLDLDLDLREQEQEAENCREPNPSVYPGPNTRHHQGSRSQSKDLPLEGERRDGYRPAEAFILSGSCLSCGQQHFLWMFMALKAPFGSLSIHHPGNQTGIHCTPAFSNQTPGIMTRAPNVLSPAITFQ